MAAHQHNTGTLALYQHRTALDLISTAGLQPLRHAKCHAQLSNNSCTCVMTGDRLSAARQECPAGFVYSVLLTALLLCLAASAVSVGRSTLAAAVW